MVGLAHHEAFTEPWKIEWMLAQVGKAVHGGHDDHSQCRDEQRIFGLDRRVDSRTGANRWFYGVDEVRSIVVTNNVLLGADQGGEVAESSCAATL